MTDSPRAHFLRDLETAQVLLSADRAVLTAPLSPAVAGAGGGARLGVLTTLVDVVTSDPAMASCPDDWLATRDLSLHTVAPLVEGPAVVEARLTRAGSSGVVVASTVYDGGGMSDHQTLAEAIDRSDPRLTRVATGLVTFARITRTAAPDWDHYTPGDWIGQVRRSAASLPDERPLYERLEVWSVDHAAGVLELDSSPYVANAIGTVTGGAQAALAEMAAEAVLPGQVAVDVQMHFLAQVGSGPIRTTCEVVRDAGDHGVVAVRLVDAGDGRLLTLVTVTLAR